MHNCPDGWHTNKDYCYQFNAHPNQKASWKDARRECQDYNLPWKDSIDVANADLVSISSSEEQKFLEDTFIKLGNRHVGDAFWMGLYKNNSKFTWTDHSTISYQNWKNKASTSANSCTKSSISIYNPGWEASDCMEKNYYVCKLKRGKINKKLVCYIESYLLYFNIFGVLFYSL